LDHRELQQYFIDRVEATSGKHIIFQADPKLSGHAMIRVAKDDQPAHVLLYRPEFESVLPYLIAFQCEFALRTILSENQFQLKAKLSLDSEFLQLMTDHLKTDKTVPKGAIPQLAKQFSTGIGHQLRSMPISLRIDKLLSSKYPELIRLQYQSIERQLQDNVHCLGPNAKSIAPAEIIRPNAMMNAAFAKFFSQLWSVPPVFSPYIAAGYEDDANKLLQILDEIPTEPENDREVVDAWAKYTKLDKWYYTETR
jgi:hypothetical protein